MTANEVLAAQATAGEERNAVQEAAEWLREALADGPKPRRAIEAAARQDGVALATLKRGAKVAGVTMTRAGFGMGSFWTLSPSFGSSDAHSAHVQELIQMGLNELNGPDDAEPSDGPHTRPTGESLLRASRADDDALTV